MKKYIGISVFGLVLFVTSCSKEQIAVNSSQQTPAPVWKNKTTLGETVGTPTSTGSGITDPNNDPDMSGTKKGNRQ